MRDMSTSMGAPWWHYVGAMLIGWAMAALMYTYQRIRKQTPSFAEVH